MCPQFLAVHAGFLLSFGPDSKTHPFGEVAGCKGDCFRTEVFGPGACPRTDTDIHNAENPGDNISNLRGLIPINQDAPPGGLIMTGQCRCRERLTYVPEQHSDKMVFYRLTF